jgi:hypothetical protein
MARMWMRRLLGHLEDVNDLIQALGRMLMEMDVKLDRIVEILEEDA